MKEWTRRVSEYFFHEEGFYTLPLNSEIPEETKFYFAGERVLNADKIYCKRTIVPKIFQRKKDQTIHPISII